MTQSTTTPSPVIPDDLAARLFDNQATVVVQPIADYRHCLYQSELALVQDVSDKRMLEFSTGRDCAHQALHKMGYEVCPILKGKQREPIWPEGIVGSISHCRDLAGAVVADKSRFHAVGFDIEHRKQLNLNIARHICTPKEKDWINQQSADNQNLGLLLIFSLKEAIFKCLFHRNKQITRFHDYCLIPDLSTTKIYFTSMRRVDLVCANDFQFRYHISDSHIYSSAIMSIN